MSAPTPGEKERGRKLFVSDWQFVSAAAGPDSLPAMRGTEIAFAGRSNVGKSSLINALTGRKALARTSHTPGRTQELIFFSDGGPLTITDMPGYGFAQAPKPKIAQWTKLIHHYLRGRSNLARVYVLIDARHGLKPVDDEIFDLLDEAAVSFQIVLTKSDEIKSQDLEACIAATLEGIRKRPAAFPEIIATSSHGGAGIPELRAAISRLLTEKGAR